MNDAVQENKEKEVSTSRGEPNLNEEGVLLNVRIKKEHPNEQQRTTSIGENDEMRSHTDAAGTRDGSKESSDRIRNLATSVESVCHEPQSHDENGMSAVDPANAEMSEALANPLTQYSACRNLNSPTVDEAIPDAIDKIAMDSFSNPKTVMVKNESHFNLPENIPDDFFEDLLNNADQLTAELSPPTVADDENGSERESNYSVALQPGNDIHCSEDRVARIKNEPLGICESDEVGDDLDNISTPRASPQRSISPELRTNSTHRGEQVDVKSEVNNESSVDCNEQVIPENFFDDLLEDSVAARLARVRDECEDIKYSEKLKELKEKLRQLEEEEEGDKRDKHNKSSGHKHKSKKSKKKAHKRDKSREWHKEREALVDSSDSRQSSSKSKHNKSSSIERVEFAIHPPQTNVNYGNLPKIPQPSILSQQPTTSKDGVDVDVEMCFPIPIPMVKAETFVNRDRSAVYDNANYNCDDIDLECLTVTTSGKRTTEDGPDNMTGFKRIKLEKHVPEPEPPLILTPAMKRQKALQIAADTIQQLHGAKIQTPFYFASTVRTLPASSSYLTQQSYENRSPLHTIHNVRYAFNSHSTRLQLRDWGLEALPKEAAKVARVVGCDADTLCTKLQAAQLSTKYIKIKKEQLDTGEIVDEVKSSLFTNAMTQTDDVYVLSARRHNGNDVGVQVTPFCGHISTQTTATSSTMGGTNEDLPLMQLINILNENQLLALNDFAELIREPADTALDMYRLRTRMLEIYKCSQLPSALPRQPDAADIRIAESSSRFNNIQQVNHRQNSSSARDPRTLGSVRDYHHNDLRAPVNPHTNSANFVQQQHPAHFQNLPPQLGQLHPSAGNAPTKYFGRGSVRR